LDFTPTGNTFYPLDMVVYKNLPLISCKHVIMGNSVDDLQNTQYRSIKAYVSDKVDDCLLT